MSSIKQVYEEDSDSLDGMLPAMTPTPMQKTPPAPNPEPAKPQPTIKDGYEVLTNLCAVPRVAKGRAVKRIMMNHQSMDAVKCENAPRLKVPGSDVITKGEPSLTAALKTALHEVHTYTA